MAINTNEIASRLFKKLLGLGETSSSNKEFYEELYNGPLTIFNNNIWTDINKIPTTLSGSTNIVDLPIGSYIYSDGTTGTTKGDSVLQVSAWTLNIVLGTNSGTEGFAFVNTDAVDIIPFNYGTIFSYDTNNSIRYNNGGANLAFGSNGSIFDPQSGILKFYEPMPSNWDGSSPFVIKGVKYVGGKLSNYNLNSFNNIDSFTSFTQSFNVYSAYTLNNINENYSDFTGFTSSFNSYSSNTLNLINTKLNSSDFNIYSSTTLNLINTKYDKTGGLISGDVTITGNLIVNGTATTVNTQNLLVYDPIIGLALSQSGSTNPTLDAGFIIDRGLSGNTGFVWIESKRQYELGYTTGSSLNTNISFSRYGKLKLDSIETNYVYDSLGITGNTNNLLVSYPNGVQWGNIDSILTGSTVINNNFNLFTGFTQSFNAYSGYTLNNINNNFNLFSSFTQSFNSYSGYTLDLINENYTEFTAFTSSVNSFTANTLPNTYFRQNGNTFGTTAVLGTNDEQSLNIITSGSSRLFVSSGGNVGIGTTDPLESLHIDNPSGNGRIFITGRGNQTGLFGIRNFSYANITASTTNTLFEISHGGWSGGIDYVPIRRGGIIFIANEIWTTSSQGSAIQFNTTINGGTTTTSKMVIDASGNVTIRNNVVSGGNINSLGARLGVHGAGSTSSTTALLIQNSNSQPSLVVRDDRRVGIGISNPDTLLHLSGNSISNPLLVSTSANTVGLFVNNLGYVGIGTTNPTTNLTINTGGANAPHGLVLTQGGGNSARLMFLNDVGIGQGIYHHGGTGALYFSTNPVPGSTSGPTRMTLSDLGNISLGDGANQSPSTRFRVQGSGSGLSTFTAQFHNSGGASNSLVIRDDGNVGINTNAPTQLLDVNGNTRLRGNIFDSLNTTGLTGNILSTTPNGIQWRNVDNLISGSTSINNKVIESGVGILSTVRVNSNNIASGNYSGVLSGTGNTASGCFSIVGGGRFNTSSGNYSTISGGMFNRVSGGCSAIVGGENNIITTNNTFILGSNLTGNTANTTFVENLSINGNSQSQSLLTTNSNVVSSGLSPLYFIPNRFDSTFIDYVAKCNNNIRAGQITSAWVNNTVVYNEITTVDVGNTNAINFSVIFSGGSPVFITSATTSNWNIKSIIRSI